MVEFFGNSEPPQMLLPSAPFAQADNRATPWPRVAATYSTMDGPSPVRLQGICR